MRRYLCHVPVGSLQRSDGLALAVEAASRPLHAQLGVFKMLFQRDAASHSGTLAARITAKAGFCPWSRFSPQLVGG